MTSDDFSMGQFILTNRFPSAIAAIALTTWVGCGTAEPPTFRLNMVQMVSQETSLEYQQEIADVLGALFGTPDQPHAQPETGLDQTKLDIAAGPVWSDAQSAAHGLYRRHCAHCHGITGDGRGPTARFLNPYPRDYRPAIYKFKSTYNAAKPTDNDLITVLSNGIPSTAMPSFALLPPSEVEALVEYVKYLSMRGQMETALIGYVYEDLGEEDGVRPPLDPASDAEQRKVVTDMLTEIADEWRDANEQVIVPEEDQIPEENRTAEEIAASVDLGRELFYGTQANCVKCHGPTGLGDGQTDDQDSWNKPNKTFLADTERLADTLDANLLSQRKAIGGRLYPVRNAIPRNLRRGIYRGGRRRLDFYRKIHTGIAGTPMPGGGPANPGAKETISDAEIWNLVDYVLSLPYEAPSQPQRALPANIEMITH